MNGHISVNNIRNWVMLQVGDTLSLIRGATLIGEIYSNFTFDSLKIHVPLGTVQRLRWVIKKDLGEAVIEKDSWPTRNYIALMGSWT